jgi:hypothetical protein
VELSITLDEAKVCNGISHLTAGIKVMDAQVVECLRIPIKCVARTKFLFLRQPVSLVFLIEIW